MEDQQKSLTKWVQILIESEMPEGVNEKIVQNYLSYFMRLLSASNGSFQFQDGCNDKMIRNQLMLSASTSQQQLKVQEQLQKLDKYYANSLVNVNSILQLLYSLKHHNSISQSQHISSIFNAQSIQNPCSSNATSMNGQVSNDNSKNVKGRQNNGSMEIECNNTTINSLQQTQQSQIISTNQSNNLNNQSLLSSKFTDYENLKKSISIIHEKGNPSIQLTENHLIRDLIYVFQAIDAQYFSFSQPNLKYQLNEKLIVSDPIRDQVNKLCVVGDMYRKISKFISIQGQGQIRESLNEAIREELNEYYRLIAIFENELNNNPTSLTLRKVQLWIIEPQERLKWLAIICEACIQVTGCQVISVVNSYYTQGNVVIQQLIYRILNNIIQPFIHFLNSWVYHGQLHDPLNEFFVSENINQNDLWNLRYLLQVQQIPHIIDKHDAQIIFNIGKSVNFLHKSCKQTDWKLNILPIQLQQSLDRRSINSQLRQWIEQAQSLTNVQIVQTLTNKYNLKSHLLSIKAYLLMGQGDFISQLIDLLGEQLNKNGNETHKHNLMGALEQAIKSTHHTNNNYLHLDISLLNPSSNDKGWDIFTLHYQLNPPLDTIFSSDVMTKYRQIFNFLWKIRRVRLCLSQVWLSHMKQSNIFSREKSCEQLGAMIKKFNILRHQMSHFVDNLSCYIMVDAIETSWKQFYDDFDKQQDLSDIISTHQSFVDNILSKSLLTTQQASIQKQINRLFTLIITFRNTQFLIITEIEQEYERVRQVRNINAQKRILGEDINSFSSSNKNYNNGNEDGDNNEIQLDSEDFQIPKTAKQFTQLSLDFQEQLQTLLRLLKKCDELRFLAFKLDFNEYYSQQQNEQLSVFNQEQLNKYSATGNFKLGNNSNNNLTLNNNPYNYNNNHNKNNNQETLTNSQISSSSSNSNNYYPIIPQSNSSLISQNQFNNTNFGGLYRPQETSTNLPNYNNFFSNPSQNNNNSSNAFFTKSTNKYDFFKPQSLSQPIDITKQNKFYSNDNDKIEEEKDVQDAKNNIKREFIPSNYFKSKQQQQ